MRITRLCESGVEFLRKQFNPNKRCVVTKFFTDFLQSLTLIATHEHIQIIENEEVRSLTEPCGLYRRRSRQMLDSAGPEQRRRCDGNLCAHTHISTVKFAALAYWVKLKWSISTSLTRQSSNQWRRLHREWVHMPPLLQMAGHEGTMNRRTANKKLTKLYWPSRKRSPKRLIVLLEPKKWSGTTKNAPPHFQIRSGAIGSNPDFTHLRISRDVFAAKLKTKATQLSSDEIQLKTTQELCMTVSLCLQRTGCVHPRSCVTKICRTPSLSQLISNFFIVAHVLQGLLQCWYQKDRRNRKVLSWNEWTDEMTLSSSAFQVLAAATGKARLPKVGSFVTLFLHKLNLTSLAFHTSVPRIWNTLLRVMSKSCEWLAVTNRMPKLLLKT